MHDAEAQDWWARSLSPSLFAGKEKALYTVALPSLEARWVVQKLRNTIRSPHNVGYEFNAWFILQLMNPSSTHSF